MDNLHVDVTSVGRDALKAALGLLFANAAGGKATHYLDVPRGSTFPNRIGEAAKEEVPRTLILFWHHETGGDVRPLPVPLDLEGATDLAMRWLAALPREDRPGWIDMDGDCEPEAWRVFCEVWGHVYGFHYAFAGVQGRWAWYGK